MIMIAISLVGGVAVISMTIDHGPNSTVNWVAAPKGDTVVPLPCKTDTVVS